MRLGHIYDFTKPAVSNFKMLDDPALALARDQILDDFTLQIVSPGGKFHYVPPWWWDNRNKPPGAVV